LARFFFFLNTSTFSVLHTSFFRDHVINKPSMVVYAAMPWNIYWTDT
jgi:hypothetical protein